MKFKKRFIVRNDAIMASCFDYIAERKIEGKICQIEISEFVEKRSIDQNKRYWALVTQIASIKETTPEVIHEFFKALFLGVRTEEIDGMTIHITCSTTGLGKKGFSEFVDECIAHSVTEWDVIFDEDYE